MLNNYKFYRKLIKGYWVKFYIDLPGCYFYIYKKYNDKEDFMNEEKISHQVIISEEDYTEISLRRIKFQKLLKKLI